MNKFQEASKLERTKMTELLQKNGIKEFGFTPDDSFEQYDGWYISNKGKKICFEIKNRTNTSTRYPTTIIEEHKYEYLINQTIGEPWLFVFFTDYTYLAEHLKVSKKYLKTRIGASMTTMGDQTMISKIVVEINITKKNTHKQ